MHRVLKQREIVADDWRHFEADGARANDARGLIVALKELRANPQTWSLYEGRLGVRIAPADKVEDLTAELQRCTLIAIEFPSPTEGRGYSQGRLLRGRFGFTGELRAVGAAVKRDLIFALARCGFDAFEVAPGEDLGACAAALDRYTVAYQPGASGSLPLLQRFSA
jgi:uncharacterized protein (DUF934 family)